MLAEHISIWAGCINQQDSGIHLLTWIHRNLSAAFNFTTIISGYLCPLFQWQLKALWYSAWPITGFWYLEQVRWDTKFLVWVVYWGQIIDSWHNWNQYVNDVIKTEDHIKQFADGQTCHIQLMVYSWLILGYLLFISCVLMISIKHDNSTKMKEKITEVI